MVANLVVKLAPACSHRLAVRACCSTVLLLAMRSNRLTDVFRVAHWNIFRFELVLKRDYRFCFWSKWWSEKTNSYSLTYIYHIETSPSLLHPSSLSYSRFSSVISHISHISHNRAASTMVRRIEFDKIFDACLIGKEYMYISFRNFI